MATATTTRKSTSVSTSSHISSALRMSEENRYSALNTAKDAFFALVTEKKSYNPDGSWSYKDWVDFTTHIRNSEYEECRERINTFRDSRAKRDAIALLDDIKFLSF